MAPAASTVTGGEGECPTNSFAIDVIVTPSIPQGTISWKYDRSVVTLRAKPCQVTRVHSYRCDLAAARPHPGQSGVALSRNGIGCQGPYQTLFNLAQKPVKVLAVALEIDDRIADELPRSVKRDVTATFYLEELHPS